MINRIDRRDKEFIALRKRSWEISQLKRDVPWRKLEKPEHNGWILTLVITQEGLRRQDNEVMSRAVELCTVPFTLHKNRAELITKLRKDRAFEKVRSLFMSRLDDGRVVYYGPELRYLTQSDYDKEIPAVQHYFVKTSTVTVSRWGGQQHTQVKYHLNMPSQYITLKITKRMLTLIQELDPELESEKDFIDFQLEEYYRNMTRGSFNKEIGGQKDPKKKRRHWKDAISHVIKNDIDEPQQYHKLKE